MVDWHTLSIIGSIVTATAMLTWFMFKQFSDTRRELYRVISQHNREDDDNFAMIDDAIWNIHLRNARIDGDTPPARKKIPRRRYLVADGGDLRGHEPGA